jgi:ABC-2 type transport system permease protein
VLLNPLTYQVDAVRALAFGVPPTLPLALSAAVLLLLAVVGVWFAYISFQRTIQRES